MGLQTILSLIEEETKEEINQIIADADERCEEIKRAARMRGDRERDRISREGERKAEVFKRKILLQAEYDSMKAEREARWSGIHTVFSAAEEEFMVLSSSPEYSKILRNLILEGRSVVGEGAITVLCRAADRNAAEKAADDLEGVTICPLPAHDSMIRYGGVILLSGDGRVRCDQTFSTRLAQMRDDLTQRVSFILYGGEADRS